ncbi:MAG: site-2 protease family protein [Candidatus Woesearchaeota archaeon]
MMFSFDLLFLVLFIVFLIIILYKNKKKLHIEHVLKIDKVPKIGTIPLIYLILYREKWGLKFMERFAKKHKKLLNVLGYLSIFVGYLGMVFVVGFLIYSTINSFFVTKIPAVQLVLPVQAKGVFYVPPLIWLLSIFIIAIVHESFHGIYAIKNKVSVKNSGFAFLGLIFPIIPAAFVEPDEETLKEKSFKEQAEIYSAGPFSNLMLGGLLLLLFLILPFNYYFDTFYDTRIKISKFTNDSIIADAIPLNAYVLDVSYGEKNKTYNNVEQLQKDLKNVKSGEEINIYYSETFDGEVKKYTLKVPEFKDSFKLGIFIEEETKLKNAYSNYAILFAIVLWILKFLFLLAQLNIGIGFANLLPIAIADGGRMFYILMKKKMNEKQALKITGIVSLIVFLVLLVNLVMPYF